MRNQLNISIALIWFCEATHALKGQQLLAQGNALGLRLVSFIRPERAKALISCANLLVLLPLQGEWNSLNVNPGRCPGLGAVAL